MKLKSLSLLAFSFFMGNMAYGGSVKNDNFNGTITEPSAIELTTSLTGKFLFSWAIINSGSSIVQIDWGDETKEEYSVTGGGGSSITHTFSSSGSYTVKIHTADNTFGDISLNNTGITAIEFKEFLIGLKQLFADNNTSWATTPDLSKLPDLADIVIQNSSLGELDLSNNSKLTSIKLYNSAQLATLQLPSSVKTLLISGTPITSFDLSGKSNLETLELSNNASLESVNLSGCTALKTVEVQNNVLTSLDVSAATALGKLDCRYNQLTKLTLPSNVSTTIGSNGLNCSNNKLYFDQLPRLSKGQFVTNGYSDQTIDPFEIEATFCTIDLSQSGLFLPIEGTTPEGSSDTPGDYVVTWDLKGYSISTSSYYTESPSYKYDFSSLVELASKSKINPVIVSATIAHTGYSAGNLTFKTKEVELIADPGTGLTPALDNDPVVATQYYNLQGAKVSQPQSNGLYIVKQIHASDKVSVKKIKIND
jgi:hypothetical protein